MKLFLLQLSIFFYFALLMPVLYGQSISVSPVMADRGKELYVGITGADFNFIQGSSTQTSCPDINTVLSNVVVQQGGSTLYSGPGYYSNNHQINVPLSIPGNAAPGAYDVTVGYGSSCPVKCNGCFNVNSNVVVVPSIQVTPSTGDKGQKLTVSISGTNVSFSQGSFTTSCPSLLEVNKGNVVFRQGSSTIYPESISQSDNHHLNAVLNLPSTASSGSYDVITGSGTSCPIICNDCFTVTNKIVPSVVVSPSESYPGSKIKLNVDATGFKFTKGKVTSCPTILSLTKNNFVLRQGTTILSPASVKYIDSSKFELNVNIAKTANQGSYDVIAGYGTDCEVVCYSCFSVKEKPSPVPSVTITPAAVDRGQVTDIIIKGTNVSFLKSGGITSCPDRLQITQSNVVLMMASNTIYPQTVSVLDPHTISVKMDLTSVFAGYYTVITGYGSACPVICSNCFLIQAPVVPVPSISLEPVEGSQGHSVEATITATDFSFNEGGSAACPNLNVTAGSVIFQQASSTISIVPESVYFQDSQHLRAVLNIPSDAPTGFYDVIVGNGSQCPQVCTNCFYVKTSIPTISVGYSVQYNGSKFDVAVHGNEVAFTQGDEPGLCPGIINVSVSNVVLRQGSTIVHPLSLVGTRTSISASFDFSGNYPSGYYDVITGYGTSCPIVCEHCLYLGDKQPPSFSAIYPYPAYLGEKVEVMLTSHNFGYTETPAIDDKNLYHVTSSSLKITSPSGYEIKPDSIKYISESELKMYLSIPKNADASAYIISITDESAPDKAPVTCSNCLGFWSKPKSFSFETVYTSRGDTVRVPLRSSDFLFSDRTMNCPEILDVKISNVNFYQGTTTNLTYSTPYLASLQVKDSMNAIATWIVPLDAEAGKYYARIISRDGCQITSSSSLYVSSAIEPFSLSPKSTYQNVEQLILTLQQGMSFHTLKDKINLSSNLCGSLIPVELTTVSFTNKQNGAVFHPYRLELIDSLHLRAYMDFGISQFYLHVYNVSIGQQSNCTIHCYNCFSRDLMLTGTTTETNTKPEIKIWPNPTSRLLNISAKGEYQVSLVNSMGEIVLEQFLNDDKTIELEHTPEGLYEVRITQEKNIHHSRLVIIK